MLIAFALLGGLLMLGFAGLAGFAAWLNNNVERIANPFAEIDPDTRPSAAPTVEGQTTTALNFLVLGSDSRISAGDPSAWVPIPGHEDAKINAAFSYGGAPLMIQTVEDLTGNRIDHFAVADFNSFTSLTDALGGVEIDVPEDTYDRGTLVVEAGRQTLDGEQALRYTRQRYGLPGGDFDRVKRQQNWIRAIATKTLDSGALKNPVTLSQLLTTVTQSVAIDDTLGLGGMRDLATSLSGLEVADLTFLTAPVAGTGWSPDGKQSIVNLDREWFDPLVAAIADDTVAKYIDQHGDDLEVLGDFVR